MKTKLHVITLTAVVMIIGMNLLEGRDKFTVTNNADYPIHVKIKIVYKKQNTTGSQVTRHQTKEADLLTKNQSQTFNYPKSWNKQPSSIEDITITNNNNKQSTTQNKKNPGATMGTIQNVRGTFDPKIIIITDDPKNPGKPFINTED